MQDGNVGFDECDAQLGQQFTLTRVLARRETNLGGRCEGDYRFLQVLHIVLSACSEGQISKRNDCHELSLAVKTVVDHDVLEQLQQVIHPRHDSATDRVRQVRDEADCHSVAQRIAVLHLHAD